MQGLPGVEQVQPSSTTHLALQPSLLTRFPSSQPSAPFFIPSPQTAKKTLIQLPRRNFPRGKKKMFCRFCEKIHTLTGNTWGATDKTSFDVTSAGATVSVVFVSVVTKRGNQYLTAEKLLNDAAGRWATASKIFG